MIMDELVDSDSWYVLSFLTITGAVGDFQTQLKPCQTDGSVCEADHGSHIKLLWAALPCYQALVFLAQGAQPECWSHCWRLRALRFTRSGVKVTTKHAVWQKSSASRFTPADQTTSCSTKMLTLCVSIFHHQWRGRLLSKHWVSQAACKDLLHL